MRTLITIITIVLLSGCATAQPASGDISVAQLIAKASQGKASSEEMGEYLMEAIAPSQGKTWCPTPGMDSNRMVQIVGVAFLTVPNKNRSAKEVALQALAASLPCPGI